MFDAELGYDFMDHEGREGIGPMAALVHVFQPDSEVRPEDANLLLLGVHVMYDFGPGLNPNAVSDRDHDGLMDDVDQCPEVAEDKDGFQDSDGCPDDDNDQDGIADKVDHCPDVAEDKDGFEDTDGCPDDDNDKDGIADKADKCPDVAEDKDSFEDDDGCPEPDNDKDGIPDAQDLCPNEPETVNGYADTDGCPDEDQVRVLGDKIVLDDRVHFYVNSFIIRKISYPLLQRLAKLVADHPEYVHISVEGHADERGPDNFNQKLSEDRARAVMEFLVKQGIAPDRLSSIGYGSTRPLVDKKSEYALLLNRRVEFSVTRKLDADGKPLIGAPSLNPTKPVTPSNPEDAPAADEPPPLGVSACAARTRDSVGRRRKMSSKNEQGPLVVGRPVGPGFSSCLRQQRRRRRHVQCQLRELRRKVRGRSERSGQLRRLQARLRRRHRVQQRHLSGHDRGRRGHRRQQRELGQRWRLWQRRRLRSQQRRQRG